MKTYLGRIIILVNDYDVAFEFYKNNFKCEKIFDQTVSENLRFLHVRFNGDVNSGIWFLKAETQEEKSLVGKQTSGQPLLVIYTDSCEDLYNSIKNNGVEILEPLVSDEGSIYFHCADLYGNRITVVELL
ncbi:VOC family protein [Flavobacterium foetidum]|uniref:VOC family protein n=1 Tax=Flavobacterium foetidum TaxID=2026681 RepID=UPI001074DF3A|nr:VOC family protein [Flavobacterium foetidum]KAF2514873.1 bleomycin resistance protein [Flavobacterium foetidum]